ncbi:ricin-type beta-trefoil lectin domain protein [Streptomyces erythrochromogenes]|uniref:ricin-type beta-trefoil lectin domain protein n=1 Tax=Streptomyces erythrochromogenes TaxID=285574 RepID=UPI0036A9C0C0
MLRKVSGLVLSAVAISAVGAGVASAAEAPASTELRDAKDRSFCISAKGLPSGGMGWHGVNVVSCDSVSESGRGWRLESNGQIVNQAWNRCLTMFDDGSNSVGLSDCGNGQRQTWKVSEVVHPYYAKVQGNKHYTIKNVESGLFVKQNGDRISATSTISHNSWDDFWSLGK